MRQQLALLLLLTTSLSAQTPIYGFREAAKQQTLEAKFDAQLSRDNLRNWMKRLTARPHHLGSAYRRACT